jgi:hypothetical protein
MMKRMDFLVSVANELDGHAGAEAHIISVPYQKKDEALADYILNEVFVEDIKEVEVHIKRPRLLQGEIYGEVYGFHFALSYAPIYRKFTNVRTG